MKSDEVGAVWQENKQGTTHNDTHGKEHVAQGQRPAFLDIYRQIHARGPNYLRVDGEFIDKDILIGTSDLYKLNHKLLDDAACIGPRGLHNGGCVNPANPSGPLRPGV